MSIDLGSLGGFLPLAQSEPKQASPSLPGADPAASSWFSGLLPGLTAPRDAHQGGAQAGNQNNEHKQSSVDWLFGHLGDAVNTLGFGDLRVADAKREERANQRATWTSDIKITSPELTDKQVDRLMHSQMIKGEYLQPGQVPAIDMTAKIGNLESKEEREKFLSTFSQFNPKDPKSAAYCAPTALMAAAMQADGAKGLAPMVASMQAAANNGLQDPTHDKNQDKAIKKQLEELEAIQEKIKTGEMTNKDIRYVQENLYKQLREQQKKDGTYDDPKDLGIGDATMYNYVKNNPYMQEAFKKGDTRLSMIDNDADGKRNHWILQMGSGMFGAKSIYDPWARKGGQIVREADQVEDYEKTNAVEYNERGRPRTDFTPEQLDQEEAERKKRAQK